MTLTARQRTKINAALCLLHDEGHNANAVIGMASRLMQDGKDPRSAYEAALNTYLSVEPAMLPTVSMMLNLVDASDDRTVHRYDAALSTYVSTGDANPLNELVPMIAEDSLALALRNGDITPEEAANGELAKALGFEPGRALQAAAAAKTEQQQVSLGETGFVAAGARAKLERETAPPMVPGATMGPTGYVALGTRAKWARETGPPTVPNRDAAESA